MAAFISKTKMIRRLLILTLFGSLLVSGCSESPDNTEASEAPASSISETTAAGLSESDEYTNETRAVSSTSAAAAEISWDEISESGVNEKLLIENIDQENLKTVAAQLQDLTRIIIQKGEADRSYWLTPQWLSDVKNSEQYKKVVSIGADAAKPLYLIIYKSPDAGLYEYICAMALDEVSGYFANDKNSEDFWVNSKDFLEKFNEKVSEP